MTPDHNLIPIIELIRLEEDSEHGTFGVLRINKQVFCVTLEPPDRENQRNRSSIPAQQYKLKRIQSSRFGETFEVCDVPFRDLIRFHPGNRAVETDGCILLARQYGRIEKDRGVLSSKDAFRSFMSAMRGFDRAHLTILECF